MTKSVREEAAVPAVSLEEFDSEIDYDLPRAPMVTIFTPGGHSFPSPTDILLAEPLPGFR